MELELIAGKWSISRRNHIYLEVTINPSITSFAFMVSALCEDSFSSRVSGGCSLLQDYSAPVCNYWTRGWVFLVGTWVRNEQHFESESESKQ